MSEVTKYQYFLDNMKLILKIKNMLDTAKFNEVIETQVIEACEKENVLPDDISLLRNFMINLDETSFYDECMKIYLQFSKYEEDNPSNISFLHFQKLELYNFLLNSYK